MSDKVLTFLRTIQSQFSKRHASPADEKIWLDSMVRGLRDYDASVLDRAAQRIIMSKTDPGFPYLAECRKACEEIIKLERAERTPKFDEAERDKVKYASADWQAKLADDLIMSVRFGLAKRAAQEGWVLSLHDFARENNRLPERDWEIRKCVDAARGFDQAYEELLRDKAHGRSTPLQNSLIHLGDGMRQRREKYRQMVLGMEAA